MSSVEVGALKEVGVGDVGSGTLADWAGTEVDGVEGADEASRLKVWTASAYDGIGTPCSRYSKMVISMLCNG
jgi:hypothetical protein